MEFIGPFVYANCDMATIVWHTDNPIPECRGFALQRQQTGFRGNVLAVNVPVVSFARKPEDVTAFYKEAIRRIAALQSC